MTVFILEISFPGPRTFLAGVPDDYYIGVVSSPVENP